MPNTNDSLQIPLPFACDTCLYKMKGRCSGPISLGTYLMDSSEVIPCVDIERRQKLFDDLYSEERPIPSSSNQERLSLPAFIPCITTGITEQVDLSANRLVAISLTTLLGKTGNLLCESMADLRDRLRLQSDVKIALIGTAKDWKIEKLWTISDRYKVWRNIADFGFEFVTSLSYSVYDENPRATHIYNQDRNFITHDTFASLGISSIPFVYPYQEEDYKAAFEWLEDRPDIGKIAVLGQFCYTDKQFSQFLKSMHRIEEGLKRRMEFLVVGVARPERIIAVMKDFTATIVSGEPFYKALFGRQILDDLTYQDDAVKRVFSRSELATKNMEKYSLFCAEQSKAKNTVFASNMA